METFYLQCLPRSPQNPGRHVCTGRTFLMWDPSITFSSPRVFFILFCIKNERKPQIRSRWNWDNLKLMWQKHVVITLTPYYRGFNQMLHLLDSCSVWRPCSCFPELYDSAYKHFICSINIVPVYDARFGQVLVLDRQESYRAQISFGTSVSFTVRLRVSVTSPPCRTGDAMFLLAARIC